MKVNVSRIVFMGLMMVFLLVSAACGGGAATPEATQAPAATQAEEKPTQPPEPTPMEEVQATEEVMGGAIDKINQVKQAVIQVEAQGSFVDPQFGQIYNSAGRGSGFIIDPSGIAVTNNHVVTGSALLKVWVGGDQSKTYNARVLGVSECADLAVIDIEGEGFPYVSWYEGPIEVGNEIYVAGFPLGDPEYSLTKGIISKAKANGETEWASVESVIEYDATTNPGNSGGPVLSPEAKVVGVHYAGNSQTRQAFGISRDFAKAIVEELKQGKNKDWIGVNGTAVSNEDGSLTGIWVSSVQSGSPADKAGIKAGDIITLMEGLVLATDGTLADYCDILRSHTSSDTLGVEVLRFATGELLEGQLNGRELAVTTTFNVGSSEEGTGTDSEQTSSSGSPSGNLNLNASASGEYIYDTEFDNPLTDWVYFFTSGTEDNVSSSLENSKLRLELNDNNTWIYFYLDSMEVGDVRLDTVVENLGRNNNNVSLICRYSDAGWYEFNVANNGEYTIYRYDPTLGDPYVPLFSGGSTAIQTGRGTNELTAICKGDKLTLGINGQEVRTISDRTLKSGKVGFSLSSFNVTPIIVEYDYFIASIP